MDVRDTTLEGVIKREGSRDGLPSSRLLHQTEMELMACPIRSNGEN